MSKKKCPECKSESKIMQTSTGEIACRNCGYTELTKEAADFLRELLNRPKKN
jgi:uncharacterized Zn finger protein (UPF0148 family)